MNSRASAPLEGVVVIVIDTFESARKVETALASAGATVFVAHEDPGCRDLLKRISPHFAVIDPTVSEGSAPQGLAWILFSYPEIRTIVYSDNVHPSASVTLKWLIAKSRPVADVVGALLDAVRDKSWVAKGGDDVKPVW